MLGRLVVGAAALAVGIGFLFDNIGLIHLTAPGMLAVLVAIIGVGLLIGTFWGRARWLIFVGIPLSFALVLTSVVPTGFVGSYGQQLWQPTNRADIRAVYKQGAGQAILDLSKIKPNKTSRSLKVEIGAGQLLVVVPKNVPVRVGAHVVGGEIRLFDHQQQGFLAEDTIRVKGTDGFSGYRITIRMGFGETLVRRAKSGDDFTNFDTAFNEFDHNVHVRINNR